ncbi:MAG: hypothetical protein P4L59_00735 [Desulfosporosinus sp.]|nr:hypothetical protein [Desulfosporosinus sp.]
MGAGRLADMDAAGLEVQVLSLAGTAEIDKLLPADAIAVARECNDQRYTSQRRGQSSQSRSHLSASP